MPPVTLNHNLVMLIQKKNRYNETLFCQYVYLLLFRTTTTTNPVPKMSYWELGMKYTVTRLLVLPARMWFNYLRYILYICNESKKM